MRLFHRETDQERAARVYHEHRWDELAKYRSRVAQGIVHTPEYIARMATEIAAWEAEQRARYSGTSYTRIVPNTLLPDFGQQRAAKGGPIPRDIERDIIEKGG